MNAQAMGYIRRGPGPH